MLFVFFFLLLQAEPFFVHMQDTLTNINNREIIIY